MKYFFNLHARTLALFVIGVGMLLSAFPATADFVSPHGPLTLDCQTCHTTDNWLKLKTDSAFTHDAQTAFPLVGRHKAVACVACHTSLVFGDADVECLDCHTDAHRGQFSAACTECHTPEQWVDERKFRASHEGTRFPLIGVHATVDCQSCHIAGQYVGLSAECASCHQADYSGTSAPDHVASGFSRNCTECHDVTKAQWTGAAFSHPETFPLSGGHQLPDCRSCHANGYANTSAVCVECHQADYTSAQNPTHEAPGFSNDCAACHTIQSWRPADFSTHDAVFALNGAHLLAQCAQCHISEQYTGTPRECAGCHQADYDAAQNPTHSSTAFPIEACAQCHSNSDWRPALRFDYHGLTAFPLTGAHVQTDCAQCHIDGQYTGTPTDCWSCHEADYASTTDPNHITGQYPQNCTVCHSTAEWGETTFDHSVTDFPLTGAHVQTDCAQCHTDGQYTGTPTDCWSCHQENYNGAEEHVANSYPQTCELCHTTADWLSTFSHALTQFPLTGAHVQTNCQECHVGGVYEGTPTDCWSCHQEDYNDAEGHVANNFPHDCALCHNTNDWDESTFNHSTADFPLTGAHVQTSCQECHVGGVYEGTPTDCWSCHQEDYNDAEGHVANNFPHDCALCHNTNDWDEGAYDHSTTDFPLTGAHVTVSCQQCHVGGQYEGTPTDCWFCHQADYNGASPDHNDGYPQECVDCHTTTNWNSTFNHDSQHFPIYSGRHDNEWNTCVECHTTPGNFTLFSCIDCHEHSNQGDVDNEHEDVGGYTYSPTSCYACHPDGNGEPGRSSGPSKRVQPGRVEEQK